MNDAEICLIRDTTERLLEADIAAANAFYTKLFEQAASVRPLFPEDMYAQSRKLIDSLFFVIEHAENLDDVSGPIRELGARHAGYGAVPDHYPVVQEVLICTLRDMMSDDWTMDHAAAWNKVLDFVVARMLEGAASDAA